MVLMLLLLVPISPRRREDGLSQGDAQVQVQVQVLLEVRCEIYPSPVMHPQVFY